jgi:hypothetical protein
MPTAEEQRRALAQQAYQAWTGGPLAAPSLAEAQANAAMFAPVAQDSPELSMLEMATQSPATPSQAPAVDPAFTMVPGPADPVMQAEQAPPGPLSRPPDQAPKVIGIPEQEVTGTAQPTAAPAGGGSGGGARRPSLLTEQSAIAAESRDRAEQTRRDADISTDMQAGLTAMKGEQEGAMYSAAAEHARGSQAELEEIGRLSEQRRAAKIAAAERVSAQVKDANEKAANIQIRDRRSTGQRVMGALAVGLSSLSDAWTGDNASVQVMSMVNEAIQRDLDIQRDNLKNARDTASAKLTEYGLAMDAVRDEDAQRLLAEGALKAKYAIGFDAIKNQGMSEAATTTAAIAAEQLRREAAQLKAQGAELEAARDEERVFQLQVQAEQERKAAARARPAAQVSDLLAKEANGTITAPELDTLNKLRLQKKAIDAGGDGDAAAVAPKGREIRNPALAQQATKEERSKFNETQNVTNALESKIDRLLRLREEHGVAVGVPQTDAYKEAQTLNREIMLGLKKKEELGTLDNQSERFLNEMTGDPNAWFINTPETQLNAVKRAAREDLESRAQGLGYSSALDQRDEYAAKHGARER